MVASVNPIAQACYFSGFEYFEVFGGYLDTMKNPGELIYNLFHNMGHIYDALTDMIDAIRFGDPTSRAYWYRIGKDIGVMVNTISYVPDSYNPYVGPIPAPPTPAANNSTKPKNSTIFLY